MLAETVSFTEQEMLLILLVVLGSLAVAAVTFVLGCFWAWRAGLGSQAAFIGWILVGPLFLVPGVLLSVPGVAHGSMFFSLPLGLLATQVALYVNGKRRAERGG